MAKRKEITIDVCLPLNGGGKEMEIEALKSITEELRDTDTYLSTLFSPQLLGFFTGQVRNDFPADVMDLYKARAQEAEEARKERDRAEKEAREHKQALDVMAKEVESQRARAMEAEEAYEELSEEARHLGAKLEAAETRASNLEESYQSATEALAGYRTRATVAETRQADLERRILELKAEIYDLQKELAG